MTTEALVEPEVYVTADRTSLERMADCPRQARLLETGTVLDTSRELESGIASHDAISSAVSEYVASRGNLGQQDLTEWLLQSIAMSRPDIQPDAIAALRPSVWGIARLLRDIHPGNMLRWDGGEGDNSGQLSFDLDEFRLRVTSELDLLYSGPSPEVLNEWDWKSGYKIYSHETVADSFQFQLHALLVFENYPDVQALSVRVWNTRFNSRSFSALFKRSDLYSLHARVRNAAAAYARYRDKAPEDVPAWPLVDKCGKCRAAHLCQASGMPKGSPEEWVDLLVALEASAVQWRDLLTQEVRRRGSDIVSHLGNAFGRSAPKRATRTVMKSYQAHEPEEESDGEGNAE